MDGEDTIPTGSTEPMDSPSFVEPKELGQCVAVRDHLHGIVLRRLRTFETKILDIFSRTLKNTILSSASAWRVEEATCD